MIVGKHSLLTAATMPLTAAAQKLRRHGTHQKISHYHGPSVRGTDSKPVLVSYDVQDPPVESTGFGGVAYDGSFGMLPAHSVQDLKVEKRFRYIKWDGK